MAPTTTATTAAGTGAVAQVIEKVTKEYNRTLTKKLLLIDALLVYSVLTALVQVKKRCDCSDCTSFVDPLLDIMLVFMYLTVKNNFFSLLNSV